MSPVFDGGGRSSFAETLALYKDRRLIVIFALGFSSGLPWVLIGSAMSAWLQEAGLTRTAIGFFGSIFAVYAFNFAWAPLLDRVRLPLLGRLGQRRSWILAMQALIAVLCVAIGLTDPAASIFWTSLLGLMIAIASSTQDVAIDAYRIEIMGEHETARIPAASAMATSGWWTGFSVPGALALMLSDRVGISWSDVYSVLAGVMVLLMTVVVLIREPASNRQQLQEQDQRRYLQILGEATAVSSRMFSWLLTSMVEPVREFFARNGLRLALSILLFVFLFKIGEAFLGRMSIVFYKEVGFTNTDIGIYSKLVGWWVVIVFSVLASFLNARFGIIRGLFIGGVAMAASNLMFSWIAMVGPSIPLFASAVIVDGFTSAFATVTFVAFISHLTSRTYTATQYALLASVGNFGRTTLAAFSGLMVDGLNGNWALFFIITALMVIPSLLLLTWIAKYTKSHEG